MLMLTHEGEELGSEVLPSSFCLREAALLEKTAVGIKWDVFRINEHTWADQ